MTDLSETPVELARDLIRCPSITPVDAGALEVLERALARGGFQCRRLTFTENGTTPVDNLFARIGGGSPHICFAGHTDVVPPGDLGSWTYPPFGGVVEDGVLYGRGAADMKGAIAAFAAAALDFAKAKGDDIPGTISLLITGDEEGLAINGTRKVLEWMAANGEQPDHALVGEPTNATRLGEAIKIGRRGSLNGRITVTGMQGHVAYPHLAKNPLRGLIALLGAALRPAARFRQRLFLAVEFRGDQHRRRQSHHQCHPGQGRGDVQHPLQRPPLGRLAANQDTGARREVPRAERPRL